MRRNFKGIGIWIAMLIIVYMLYSFFVAMTHNQVKMVYSDLVNNIKTEQVKNMSINGNTVTVTLVNGQMAKVQIPSLDTLQSDAGEEISQQMEKGSLTQEAYESKISWTVISNVVLIGITIFLFFFLFVKRGGGGAGNFTKSRAKLNIDNVKVTFKKSSKVD